MKTKKFFMIGSFLIIKINIKKNTQDTQNNFYSK